MAEIVIDSDMKELTADIISKACFGGSYALGNQIFAKITALQNLVSSPTVLFGFLYLRFHSYILHFPPFLYPLSYDMPMLYTFIYIL